MIIDSAFQALLPFLQQPEHPTLWLADESASNALQNLSVSNKDNLYIVTNRYDIYQLALKKNLKAEFSDFELSQLSFAPQRIIYRISKEKPLVHHLLNQAAQLLPDDGELIISGKKLEGIKTYADKLAKNFNAQGKIKKQGTDYFACFKHFLSTKALDDQDYSELQKITTNHIFTPFFYSKPGVFGWNKIDNGSELLLSCLPDIFKAVEHKPKSILDLGCGYGWLFLNLAHYLPESLHADISVTATDNNAAAILCAEKNSQSLNFPISVIADDCAQHLNQRFDCILCNPPFHQGFSHAKELTQKFLAQIHSKLSNKGIAVIVINEFIKLPPEQLAIFKEHKIINHEKGFKVILLR